MRCGLRIKPALKKLQLDRPDPVATVPVPRVLNGVDSMLLQEKSVFCPTPWPV
jgi:hypothetical protein